MPLNNIILIGFMGSGKTSIGKRLSQHFYCDYCDTDQLIIEKEGAPISKIIEWQGEKTFREMESAVLENLLETRKPISGLVLKNMILSTGGGIILQKKNRELLRSLGTVLWLHASPDILFDRAMRNDRRPLLNVENPRHTFNDLLRSRLPLYEEASHLQVDTSNLSYTQTMAVILKAIDEFHLIPYPPNNWII